MVLHETFSQWTKFPWEHFGIKKFGDKTFCACVNMPLLTQGGIYRLEFQHENNDHPVSQVLDMQLSWNLSWRITLTREVELWRHQPFFSDVSRNSFWFVKYTRVMWHGWWRHQSNFFFKDDPWCKLQLHGIRRTWDTRAGVYNLSPPQIVDI